MSFFLSNSIRERIRFNLKYKRYLDRCRFLNRYTNGVLYNDVYL